MENLTIGTVARQAGVGVETIRFYERRGLISQPAKPPGAGRRRYAPETVERIRFIRQAQHLGFVLREIQELLSLQANPAADCSDVRSRALLKIEEVNKRIAQLAEIRSALVRLLAACPGSGALGACSILEALRVTDPPNIHQQVHSAKRIAKRGAMKTAILGIDGMHCEGCAKTIEALLGAAPGVQRATVSFQTREAQVQFDPKATDDAHLAAAIERAGYKVVAAGQ